MKINNNIDYFTYANQNTLININIIVSKRRFSHVEFSSKVKSLFSLRTTLARI